jgi:hypothetical protein
LDEEDRGEEEETTMKAIVVILGCCAILWNSAFAAGQTPVPFKSLMQSPGAQQVSAAMATGDRHNSPADLTSATHTGALTPRGKGMMIGGITLVAVGAVVIAFDVAFGSAMGTKGAEGRTAAGYIGGAAAAGTGVTLIVFGSRNRSR